MKKIPPFVLLLVLLCIPSTIGCLILGGKTYTTGSTPEMENRIFQLEQRIRNLEQINGVSSQPAPQPGSYVQTGLVQPGI